MSVIGRSLQATALFSSGRNLEHGLSDGVFRLTLVDFYFRWIRDNPDPSCSELCMRPWCGAIHCICTGWVTESDQRSGGCRVGCFTRGAAKMECFGSGEDSCWL